MIKYVVVFFILVIEMVHSQNDTIRLKDSNIRMMVGEVKSISTGVLTIETNYSDSDFKIELDKVIGLNMQRKCLIILTDNRRRFGNIKTDASGLLEITLNNGEIQRFKLEEVIALKEVDANFWSRFIGSIDFGYNKTKANNNTQFTIGGSLNYTDNLWLFKGNFGLLNSTRDDVDNTERTNADIELIRILSRKWYLLGNASFLSNTEQALEGRISPSLGAGRFLITTSKLYLGLTLGVSYNIENYVDASLNKTSFEAVTSVNFNMFDFEDIDLTANLQFYPSLSESRRIRTDFDIALKYDLPWDLYIKLSYTLNFDNQPATGGSDTDYIFTTGFGWDFD